MSNLIQLLASHRGELGEALVPRDASGIQDLSGADWTEIGVVRGVSVRDARLRARELNINFVETRFDRCHFEGFTARNHFWGAEDIWRACTFERLQLFSPVAFKNTFEDCRFNDCLLSGVVAADTRFLRCEFVNLNLEAFGVASGRTAIFEDCVFQQPIITTSRFSGAAFLRCSVVRPSLRGVSFAGAKADTEWWPHEIETGDPFLVWLDSVLRMIEAKVGESSRAYAQLSAYRNDFATGKTTSKDFSKCLFATDVPDEELDEIEDAVIAMTKKVAR